jgi:hypothetical protein
MTRQPEPVADPGANDTPPPTGPPHRRHSSRSLPLRLQQFAIAFAEAHQHTDHEFVGMGQALRQLHRTAQSLAALVRERLAAMRDAVQTSRLGGTDGLAARCLGDLQAGLAGAANELHGLLAVADDLRRLRGEVARIRRVAMFVRTSAFGFALESARNPDWQPLFSSLVGALRELADRITGLAEAMETHARQAQSVVEAEWKGLSATHASLAGLVRELATAAEVSATAAQSLLDHLLDALQHAETRMDQITQRADEAVYYLQFGDIVRQKTEHVGAALHEAAGQLQSAVRTRSFRAQATRVDQTLAVQIAQLDAIRKEVQTAQGKLGDAFHGLHADTAALPSLLDHWHQHPAAAPPETDAFQAFRNDWQRLERLQHRGHELRQGASQTAHQAIAVSSRLSVHMEEVKTINTEVHFQALNAIVRTAALGHQGATLSVLSMHLDWLYREADAIVREIVPTLEAILARADQTRAPRAAAAGPSSAAEGLERLEAAFRACRQTSLDAEHLMAEQQTALEGSRDFLGYLEAQLPTLERQIAELVSFRRLLVPWVESSDRASAPATDSPHDRYTMRSERDIHNRVHRHDTGGPSDADGPLTPLPPATRAPDSLITADPTPAPLAPDARDGAAPPNTPATLGANVELF